MCIKVVEKDSWWFKDVSGKFKTHEIYDKAVRSDPNRLRFSPVDVKIQEICNEAIKKEPWMLEDVPDHFKKQKRCGKAVEKSMFLITLRGRKCVMMLLKKIPIRVGVCH